MAHMGLAHLRLDVQEHVIVKTMKYVTRQLVNVQDCVQLDIWVMIAKWVSWVFIIQEVQFIYPNEHNRLNFNNDI